MCIRFIFMLAFLFFVKSAWAIELVKIATLPKGCGGWYQRPVGDADHDGWQELYFYQTKSPFPLNIWEHWGENSYQPVLIEEGSAPDALGDPDQDGLSDLLCQWGPRAFLLESKSPTRFPSRTVWEESLGGFPGIRGYFRDIDKDGNQEMWIVPNDPDQIEVWENRGDNEYKEAALLTYYTMNPETLAFGDFDGDGLTEIVVGESQSLIHIWENTGDDTYELTRMYQFPDSGPEIVTSANDLDGDGRPEFLTGGRMSPYSGFPITSGHVVTVFEAIGDNTYEPIWETRGPEEVTRIHVVVGDIDGDGLEEFAIAISGWIYWSGFIRFYKAFGDNDFRLVGELPYPNFEDSYAGIAITLADLNENGIDEVIVLAPDGKHTLIYELADIQPPVLIQAFYTKLYEIVVGKTLKGEIEILNLSGEEKNIDAWLEVYKGKGEGGPKGKRISRKRILRQALLLPEVPLGLEFKLHLPLETGNYTVQLKVGTYPDTVIDTRWFTVKVK